MGQPGMLLTEVRGVLGSATTSTRTEAEQLPGFRRTCCSLSRRGPTVLRSMASLTAQRHDKAHANRKAGAAGCPILPEAGPTDLYCVAQFLGPSPGPPVRSGLAPQPQLPGSPLHFQRLHDPAPGRNCLCGRQLGDPPPRTPGAARLSAARWASAADAARARLCKSR